MVRSVLVGPEEGSHGEAALAVEVAVSGEAVLTEQAVDAPLRHALVVRLLVARVVQRHPEAAAAAEDAAALLPLPLRLLAAAGLGHDAQAHGRAQGSHARRVEVEAAALSTLQARLPLLGLVALALSDAARMAWPRGAFIGEPV